MYKRQIHDGEAVNRPNNAQEIYLKELGSESPMLVRLIMKSTTRHLPSGMVNFAIVNTVRSLFFPGTQVA